MKHRGSHVTVGLTALLVLAAGGMAQGAALVGYWPMNEGSGTTITDSVSSIVGTFQVKSTGPAPAWLGSGYDGTGNALGFNGDSGKGGYVTAAAPAGLDLDEMTLSFWLNMPVAHRSWGMAVTFNTGTNTGFDFEPDGNGKLGLYGSGVAGIAALRGSTSLNEDTGTWHHVAVTMSSSANVSKLYVDGVVDGVDATRTWSATAAVQTIWLGYRTWTQWALYRGDLDDVAVWDVALPESSITGLADKTLTPQTAPVPEPATMSLLALSGLGVLLRRRRRQVAQ